MQFSFSQTVLPTRRHRTVVLALALMAAGIFFVFLTRGSLISGPLDRFRTCSTSVLFQDLSFFDLKERYHYTMEQLVEERMRLYEGTTLLQCDAQTMDDVIPQGTLAREVARALPDVPDWPTFSYRHFELLLHEFWRTYDCHLFTLRQDPGAYYTAEGDEEEHYTFSQDEVDRLQRIDRERERARIAFDRLISTLRAAEEYLPLHASLRCLQRGAADVRNAVGLLSDAAQCVPARLGQPETSLRK